MSDSEEELQDFLTQFNLTHLNNPSNYNSSRNSNYRNSNYQTRTMGDNLKSIVQLLKPFGGEKQYLEYFISNIEEFYTTYYTGEIAQKEYVITAIKSKLINEAGNFLMSRPDLKTWLDIKNALRLKYGDPYSRQNLVQELMYTTRNAKENVFDYLEKLKSLNHRITSKIMSDQNLVAVANVLVAQNEIMAIQNLVTNSPVELRTILMVQNPQTLDAATAFVLNYQLAENHMKFNNSLNKNTNTQSSSFTNFKPKTQTFTQFPKKQFVQTQFPQKQFQQSQFPSQPINIQPRANYQPRFPTSSQTFGKNLNKQSNVFKKNTNQQFPKPTPMSGISVQPRTQIFNKNFQQRPVQYTIKEENNILQLIPVEQDFSENENFEEETYPSSVENQENQSEFEYQDFSENPDEPQFDESENF